LKIEYIKHSIGNNFGDLIELNENLKKYPNLHDSILRHELKHTNKFFTLSDLKTDLTDTNVDSYQLLKFMLRYPKSFFQFFPVYWNKKHGFIYDLNLILIYILVSCITYICIVLFNKIV